MACSSIQACVGYLVKAMPRAKDLNVVKVSDSHYVLDLLNSLREEHFLVVVSDVATPIGIKLCADHFFLKMCLSKIY